MRWWQGPGPGTPRPAASRTGSPLRTPPLTTPTSCALRAGRLAHQLRSGSCTPAAWPGLASPVRQACRRWAWPAGHSCGAGACYLALHACSTCEEAAELGFAIWRPIQAGAQQGGAQRAMAGACTMPLQISAGRSAGPAASCSREKLAARAASASLASGHHRPAAGPEHAAGTGTHLPAYAGPTATAAARAGSLSGTDGWPCSQVGHLALCCTGWAASRAVRDHSGFPGAAVSTPTCAQRPGAAGVARKRRPQTARRAHTTRRCRGAARPALPPAHAQGERLTLPSCRAMGWDTSGRRLLLWAASCVTSCASDQPGRREPL